MGQLPKGCFLIAVLLVSAIAFFPAAAQIKGQQSTNPALQPASPALVKVSVAIRTGSDGKDSANGLSVAVYTGPDKAHGKLAADYSSTGEVYVQNSNKTIVCHPDNPAAVSDFSKGGFIEIRTTAVSRQDNWEIKSIVVTLNFDDKPSRTQTIQWPGFILAAGGIHLLSFDSSFSPK